VAGTTKRSARYQVCESGAMSEAIHIQASGTPIHMKRLRLAITKRRRSAVQRVRLGSVPGACAWE
jgi:hypothetical protein